MRRVYRIETESGRGICAATGSPLCELYLAKCGDENEHCSLNSEAIWRRIHRTPTMSFAFPTLEALESWFPQARGRDVMQKHGARGVIYEVDALADETPYQCVFDKARATQVGTFDLRTA